MKSIVSFFLILLVSFFSSLGCSRTSLLPVHDEVLVYPLPMDLTFLRTLEAVQKHPDWELELTDKEKGLITLRNIRYSSFADADLRVATIVLKRVGPQETSVQFHEKSRAIVGGDEILKLVKEYLVREVGLRTPPK